MSMEDKIQELMQLAEELKEKELDSLEGAKDEKEDEPEGSDDSEIELDAEESDEEGEESDEEEPKEVKESMEKIDLGALFEGEELSEEFKQKVITVFESAVAIRVKQEVEMISESMEKEAVEITENFVQHKNKQAAVLEESLVDKVDGYLDYMVEQWMNSNQLAIDRGIKTEILESFVSGMKDLFESHYIDVPDEKYDLVEAAQEEAKELREKLDEAVEEAVAMKRALKEVARHSMIGESTKDMVESDAERFCVLAEELTFSSEGEFAKKLDILKENYFKAPAKQEAKIQEEFITDTPVEVIEESTDENVNPAMKQYLAAIRRGI